MTKKFLSAVLFVFITVTAAYAQSSWTILPSGTDASLHGVDFLDDNNGIVVGDKGTILMTSDGGVNWEILNSGVTLCLNSVSYIDVNSIIVAGNKGLILKTIDGGVTWKSLNIGLIGDPDLLTVDMSHTGKGIAGGRLKTLITTKDYGDTWLIVAKNGAGNFNSVRILDEETAFTFGDNSRFNHVIGKVTNFENLTINDEYQIFNNHRYSEGSIIDGYPVTGDSIITIGVMYNFPNQDQMSYIARSEIWVTDLWLPIFHADSSFYTGFDMINRHGIAVGGRITSNINDNKGYLISESYDQGQIWTDVQSPAGTIVLNDVKLLANIAYIVGENGLIMKSAFSPLSKLNVDFNYHSKRHL